jgi:hypothetical protein
MSQIAEIHSHPEVELWQKAAKIPKLDDAQLRDENTTSLEYLEIYQGTQPLTIKKDVGRQQFADYCKVGFSSTLLRCWNFTIVYRELELEVQGSRC